MVEESKRAWHAGVSAFNGIGHIGNTPHHGDVNSSSIGIEIANYGINPNEGIITYPAKQTAAVVSLCKDILSRYNILPFCVVGHSDIAPVRKIDPGFYFPWNILYDNGIGLFPKELKNMNILDSLMLALYGYDVSNLENTKKTVQLHFYYPRAWLSNKAYGDEERCILMYLIMQKYKHYSN